MQTGRSTDCLSRRRHAPGGNKADRDQDCLDSMGAGYPRNHPWKLVAQQFRIKSGGDVLRGGEGGIRSFDGITPKPHLQLDAEEGSDGLRGTTEVTTRCLEGSMTTQGG